MAFLEPSSQENNVEDFYPEFGRRIRLARRRAHLSQDTLGRLTGLNRTSITNIEDGRQRIPLHLLVSFATALDVEPWSCCPAAHRLIYLLKASQSSIEASYSTSSTRPGQPLGRPRMRKTDLTAQQLLTAGGIEAAPVDVFALTKIAGADVVQHEFEENGDISGMLYRDETRTVIGVNAAHSLTRQRFTVAHELGHLRLHPGRPLILDAPARVNFRDRTARIATDREKSRPTPSQQRSSCPKASLSIR
jgi:transcriptional regulator with XRE-family HTH domain